MALDLGTAWIQISPSLRGVKRAVEQELAGVDPTPMSSRLSGAFSSVAKAGAATVATLGTAVVGLAAKGGFARALSIEQSQAKLIGLGHDAASVSGVMDSALKSVKGTAYGLGDAATVAASLTASGVKSGEDLTKVLTTVADTAQISGRSMVDVGAIFGSVAARGKLQGDDMLQLMSAGVPVLQFLSERLGVTSADVSEMVSKGQIDFQTFADAMEAGLGGAAQSAGSTFTGAWSNVMAALSRVGAAGAVPVLDGLRSIFNDLIPLIDEGARVVQPFFDAFSERTAGLVERITGGMSTAADALRGFQGINLSGLGAGLAAVAPLLGAASGAFASTLGGLPVVGSLFAGITGPIGAVAGLVAGMLSQSPALREALAGIGQAVSSGLGEVLPQVLGLLPQFAGLLGSVGDAVAPIIANLAETLLPILLAALPPIIDLLGVGLDLLTRFAGWLASNSDAATAMVMGLLGGFAAMKAMNIGTAIFGSIQKGVGLVVGAVKALGVAFAANPVGLVIAAIAALVAGLVWAYNNIEPFRDFVDGVFQRIRGIAGSVAEWFAGPFVDFFRGLWDAITGFFAAGRDQLTNVFQSVGDFFAGVGQGIADVWARITGAFQAAVEWVAGVFGPIWSQVSAILLLPINLARTLIGAAWDWVTARFQQAWDWVSGVFGAVWAGLVALLSGPIDAARDWLSNTWTAILGVFTTAWVNVTGWLASSWNTLTGLIGLVIDLARDWLSNTWGSILGVFAAAWANITGWVSTQWNQLTDMLRGPVDRAREWIDTALNGIRGAFDSAVAFIVQVWDGIIEAVKRPIRFVMVTVIDNGLIAGFNKIADFAGSPKLSTITPPGFASGGYVDLPWSASNRDPYLGATPNGLFRFEGQEFIVNRASTRKHRALLEAINADRYQDGGLLDGVTTGLGNIAAGLLDFLANPLGTLTGIIDRLLGGFADSPILQLMVGIPRKIASMIAEWVKSKLVVPEMAGIPGGAWSGGLPAAGVITSGYGFRYGPFLGAEHHDGIDIGAPMGAPVHSALPGVVSVAGWVGGYGNYVEVMSGAISMFYAHLSAILARVGQLVSAGQVIGLVGSTGFSTGPHLHWGARMNGASINPLSVGGYAAGTVSARRGLAWVGEQGPELVDFRGGERVWSARDSATAGTTVVFSPTYTAERSARRDVEDVMAEVRRLAHV